MPQPIERALGGVEMSGVISRAHEFWQFIKEELKPTPDRAWSATRIVVAAVATVIVGETLRIPFPAFSAYLVFFVANEDALLSIRLGTLAMITATAVLAGAIGVAICFMDAPWFRLPSTLFLVWGSVWLSRTLAINLIGIILGVILSLYLSLADTIFDAETLTKSTLWLWSVVGLAVAITVLVDLLLTRGLSKPAQKKESSKGFVSDAFTNPDYAWFASKTIFAVILCEIFMNAVNWPGIRTSMITCVVTALATDEKRHQKQMLRVLGVCAGGLVGLFAILFVIPQLDSIVGLTLLIAAATFPFAWVAAGSPRSSYAGFQMALAFYMMLLPGFDTSIDLTSIRDRFVGILIGNTAMWIMFDVFRSSSDSTVRPVIPQS